MKNSGKVVVTALIAVMLIGTFFFLWKKSQPKETEYEILQATLGTIENKTVATGKVEPRDEILIKPQISGIVSEVLKEAGQRVKQGEVIATVKVIPEMGQLNSAESRLRLAEIALTQAKLEFDRQKSLFQKGIIAKEEFEANEATYQRTLEEKDNAKDALEIVKNGISKRFESLSNTQIRATITGTILDVPIKVGNSVIQANTFNDGTTIASIADMSNMIFKGKVDETEVGRIKENMPLSLSIGALNNQVFPAVLEYISPKGTEENGAVLFEIKAAAKIPEGVFVRAGYSANAEIVLDKAEEVITLQESAIEFSNDSAFVYLLKQPAEKQVFEKKQVQVGLSDGIKIEIKEGLSVDDKVRGNSVDKKKPTVN